MQRSDIIYVDPYSNSLLYTLDEIALYLLRLGRLPLDEILSAFGPTTIERKRINRWILIQCLWLPLMLVLLVFSLPFVTLGAVIWLSFQHHKTHYRLSIKSKSADTVQSSQSTFSFATANVCLMQQCLCRFNNQKDPKARARRQGDCISQQQKQRALYSCKNATDTMDLETNGLITGNKPHRVVEEFPQLDLLLLQVWRVLFLQVWRIFFCFFSLCRNKSFININTTLDCICSSLYMWKLAAAAFDIFRRFGSRSMVKHWLVSYMMSFRILSTTPAFTRGLVTGSSTTVA